MHRSERFIVFCYLNECNFNFNNNVLTSFKWGNETEHRTGEQPKVESDQSEATKQPCAVYKTNETGSQGAPTSVFMLVFLAKKQAKIGRASGRERGVRLV